MKLSALTLSAAVATITTASTIVAAFTSPSNLVFERMTTTSATSSLRRQQAVRGEDVREGKWHAAPLASFDCRGRVGSSPGHFETHGIPTLSRRVSYHGPPLASFDTHGRVGASPGSFETHGSSRSAAAGRSYVIGDAVRETRTSYAPFDHRDGRVGTIGEIGTEGNNDNNNEIGNGSKRRSSYIPASGYYIQPIVADEFVPQSSSSSYASSSGSSSSRNNIASGGGSSSYYSSTPAKKAGYGLGGWKK